MRSSDQKVLCSCRGHNQNVALASLTPGPTMGIWRVSVIVGVDISILIHIGVFEAQSILGIVKNFLVIPTNRRSE